MGPGDAAEELDSLDAYMQGVASELAAEAERPPTEAIKPDVETSDDEEAPPDYRRPADDPASDGEESGECCHSSDEKEKESALKLVLPVDHSQMEYPTYTKGVYLEAAELSALLPEERAQLRQESRVRVAGFRVAPPISNWEQLKPSLNVSVYNHLRRTFARPPSGLQGQVLAVCLGGSNVLVVAPPGSGKLVAMAVPMVQLVVRVLEDWKQMQCAAGSGPVALVLTPTREEAAHVFATCQRLCEGLKIRCSCAAAAQRKRIFQELAAGVEIVVGNLARVVDLATSKHGLHFRQCVLLAAVGADRLLGSAQETLSVARAVRPDRVTWLFSTSRSADLDRVADVLAPKAVRIYGQGGSSAGTLEVLLFSSAADKVTWLQDFARDLTEDQQTLVYADQVGRVIDLVGVVSDVLGEGAVVDQVHGGLSHFEREAVVRRARQGETRVIVATDARGLAFSRVTAIVSFDAPRAAAEIESRSIDGAKAFVLVSADDCVGAAAATEALRERKLPVPTPLLAAARRHYEFRLAEKRGLSMREFQSRKTSRVERRGMGFDEAAVAGSSVSKSVFVPQSKAVRRALDAAAKETTAAAPDDGLSSVPRAAAETLQSIAPRVGQHKVYGPNDDIPSSDEEEAEAGAAAASNWRDRKRTPADTRLWGVQQQLPTEKKKENLTAERGTGEEQEDDDSVSKKTRQC